LRVARRWSCLLQNNVAFSKDKLRKDLRSKRLAIDIETRQAAALAAVNLFIEQPLFKKSMHFACYLPHGGEFDVMPLMQMIWRAQKNCYLPVLSGEKENFLQFIAYRDNDVLQTNRHHILEPEYNKSLEIAAADIDVVLVPLTAFDSNGYRLGSGGGYYDRSFAFLHSVQRPHQPYLIGVGYADQQVDDLPHDEWDVKLDGVLTEQKFMLF
jgi:5-formyltetrahydrofolate cyclo-ligase